MYDGRFRKWGVTKYSKKAKPTPVKVRDDRSRLPTLHGGGGEPPTRDLPSWSVEAGPDIWLVNMQLTVAREDAAYGYSEELHPSESYRATAYSSWVSCRGEMFGEVAVGYACICGGIHHHHNRGRHPSGRRQPRSLQVYPFIRTKYRQAHTTRSLRLRHGNHPLESKGLLFLTFRR